MRRTSHVTVNYKKKRRNVLQRGLGRTLAVMDRVGILDLLAGGRRLWPRRALVVLNYHRVIDHETELDEGVISATADEFDEQMRLLSETASCLSVDDLVQVLRGDMALPDNAVMITFDDGYADNFETALPSLLRHGVRATFFITTGYIETGRLPWWDRVSYVLKRTTADRIQIRYPVQISLSLLTPRDRLRARRTLLRVVKQVCGLDHERFFADIEEAAGVHVDEEALSKGLFMSWAQIAELQAAGMDIGAHTHSHRVLQTLGDAEAAEELQLPTRLLRERLGVTPHAIAYPVGFPLGPASQLRRLVQEAGYEVGFTFVPGVITPPPHGPPVDRFNLPRLPVDRSVGSAAARFKMALLAPASLL
jgi:peptidoglycan/xylan/chitin deacetylase (PgdA/CDA1 family)